MGYNIVKYREECVSLQIHFHPDVFMDLFSDSLRDNQLYFLLDLTLGQKNFIQGRCSEQLYCSIRYVYEETREKKTNYQKLIDLYFAQILLLMSRDMGNTKSGDNRSNRHLLSAFEYISRHYPEKITVEELAEYSLTQLALEVGFGSLQHFSKVFKNTMNISPTKFFRTRPFDVPFIRSRNPNFHATISLFSDSNIYRR